MRYLQDEDTRPGADTEEEDEKKRRTEGGEI